MKPVDAIYTMDKDRVRIGFSNSRQGNDAINAVKQNDICFDRIVWINTMQIQVTLQCLKELIAPAPRMIFKIVKYVNFQLSSSNLVACVFQTGLLDFNLAVISAQTRLIHRIKILNV